MHHTTTPPLETHPLALSWQHSQLDSLSFAPMTFLRHRRSSPGGRTDTPSLHTTSDRSSVLDSSRSDENAPLASTPPHKKRAFTLFPRRFASHQHLPATRTTPTPPPTPVPAPAPALPTIAVIAPDPPDTLPDTPTTTQNEPRDAPGLPAYVRLGEQPTEPCWIDGEKALELKTLHNPITRMPVNYWFLDLPEEKISEITPNRVIELIGPNHSKRDPAHRERYCAQEQIRISADIEDPGCVIIWASPIDNPLLPFALLIFRCHASPPTPALLAFLGTIGIGSIKFA